MFPRLAPVRVGHATVEMRVGAGGASVLSEPPRKGPSRRPSARAPQPRRYILIRQPGEARSRRLGLRHVVGRAPHRTTAEQKALVDLIRRSTTARCSPL
jgi:hypothetical protein